MSSKTLLVVDGTAMAYRAFYAIANLTTKAGTPTNAVYGFIRLFRQLEQTWKPTHWVVAFDGGNPAERMALLPTYKAQRKEMPDSLSQQLLAINDYLECCNVPYLWREAEEADDFLATYALWGRSQGATVLVATSDKDMFQLVDDQVSIVSLTKAGEKMGPAQVKEKTGVRPEQIVDWLALTGDSSDNIPGVPGVGGKTAAKLLEQFGTLDSMWTQPENISSERLRQAILAARENVARNQKMMKLRADMPRELDWDNLQVRSADFERCSAFLEKMEFNTMLRNFQEQASRLF